MSFVRRLLILSFLALWACQGPEDSTAVSPERTFRWNDLSRPVSFPGPLTESDSAHDRLSLHIVANLANNELDSIRMAANDSVFVAVAETPYMSQLEGMAQLEAWRASLGEVRYEAFNVRGIYNQGSNSHVSYVFGRWVTESPEVPDHFLVFTVAWNSAGKITGIALFKTGWPRDSLRPIKPSRTPEKFHFYSATTLGSDSSAIKAMDFTEAIFRNNLRRQQHLLADTVEYHDGQGEYGTYGRAQVLDLLDHRPKDHTHHLVRYTAVVPWTMLRFNRDMAVVVTYEDWRDNASGNSDVYSFCRLYFFDEQGKINNFVFTRRRVYPVGRYPLVN